MSGGTRGRLLPSLCIGVALGAVALNVGCGGDEEASGAKEPRFAAAEESPDAFMKRMAKLLETTTAAKDCAALEAINGRSYTRFPCPPPKSLRKSMARFELIGAKAYGTGGVVDYKSGEVEDGGSILLFVGVDRAWGVGRFGVIAGKTVGTSDEKSRDGFADAVDGYLDAVRTRDCDAYFDHSFNNSEKKKAVCRTVFPNTKALAKRLKDNPTAEPEYQGGNEQFGFYSLETSKPKPENVTISIAKATAKAPQPYVVMDVAPSPTAADQRRVVAEFEKQRRQKAREQREQKRKQEERQKQSQSG